MSRPASSLEGKITPQSSGQSPSPEPEIETASNASSSSMLSVVQVIPSRLPDGQVVFLLPSHYVQLAAAAAASEGGATATLWATTNGTNLIATTSNNDRPAKLCFQSNTFIGSNQNIEDSIETDSDQPIDFTVTKRKEDKEDDDPRPEEEAVWRPW